MRNMSILVLVLFISGCVIVEEDIDALAGKMQQAYDGIKTLEFQTISTLKYSTNQSSPENIEEDVKRGAVLSDGYITSKFVSYTFIEQPDKTKIENSQKEGYISDTVSLMYISNVHYREDSDSLMSYNCSEKIRKDPNFVQDLQDIMKKHKIEVVGMEEVDGKEAIKIKLEEDYIVWVDKKTYLPLKETNGQYETVYLGYKINEEISPEVFMPNPKKKIIEQDCFLDKGRYIEERSENIPKDVPPPVFEKKEYIEEQSESVQQEELFPVYFVADPYGFSEDVTILNNLSQNISGMRLYYYKTSDELSPDEVKNSIIVYSYDKKFLIVAPNEVYSLNAILISNIHTTLKEKYGIVPTYKKASEVKSSDLASELKAFVLPAEEKTLSHTPFSLINNSPKIPECISGTVIEKIPYGEGIYANPYYYTCTTYTCIDTDGGDPYLYGAYCYPGMVCEVKMSGDRCWDDKRLHELYCMKVDINASPYPTVYSIDIDCPHGCINGACVKPESGEPEILIEYDEKGRAYPYDNWEDCPKC